MIMLIVHPIETNMIDDNKICLKIERSFDAIEAPRNRFIPIDTFKPLIAVMTKTKDPIAEVRQTICGPATFAVTSQNKKVSIAGKIVLRDEYQMFFPISQNRFVHQKPTTVGV